jgi:hypothetical protein
MKKNKIIVVILAFFLFSCSPANRLKRLLNKHPELIHTKDTIIIDTIITASIHYDSLIKANHFKDTIVIIKNNLTTKFFYNNNTDSLYIYNNLKADTIYKTITIPGKTIEVNTNKTNKGLFYLFVIFLILLIIYGIIKAINKQ